MTTTARSILLRGDGVYKEGVANGAITPGHFVKRDSAGKFVVGTGDIAVAEIPDWQGNNSGISTAYASGDQINVCYPARGSEIYALVAAAAPAIAVGDTLDVAATGTVIKHTSGTIIGKALEAIDNSGGGSSVRIRIELTT